MKKFLKETKKKIGDSMKELQENFGESKEEDKDQAIGSGVFSIEEQYSNEDKQKELTNLHKLVMKSESILNSWESKVDEVVEIIQKLKEYRDSRSIIWESYNSRTKSMRNPNGWATNLLNSLELKETKANKSKESVWEFKEKSSSEKVLESNFGEMNQQLVIEEVKTSKIYHKVKNMADQKNNYLDLHKLFEESGENSGTQTLMMMN